MLLSAAMGIQNFHGTNPLGFVKGILSGSCHEHPEQCNGGVSLGARNLTAVSGGWAQRPFLTGQLKQAPLGPGKDDAGAAPGSALAVTSGTAPVTDVSPAGGASKLSWAELPAPTPQHKTRPLSWLAATFATPTASKEDEGADGAEGVDTSLLLDAQGLSRGHFYVNGHDLGRYYMIHSCANASLCPLQFSQRFYYIPREVLLPAGSGQNGQKKLNTLVAIDELGAQGLPSLASSKMVPPSPGKTCADGSLKQGKQLLKSDDAVVPAELAWLHSELPPHCYVEVHAETWNASATPAQWQSACPNTQPFRSTVDTEHRGIYWHKDDPADFYGEVWEYDDDAIFIRMETFPKFPPPFEPAAQPWDARPDKFRLFSQNGQARPGGQGRVLAPRNLSAAGTSWSHRGSFNTALCSNYTSFDAGRCAAFQSGFLDSKVFVTRPAGPFDTHFDGEAADPQWKARPAMRGLVGVTVINQEMAGVDHDQATGRERFFFARTSNGTGLGIVRWDSSVANTSAPDGFTVTARTLGLGIRCDSAFNSTGFVDRRLRDVRKSDDGSSSTIASTNVMPLARLAPPRSPANCSSIPEAGVDKCAGGPPGYWTAEVGASAAAAECAALCCASARCSTWVTRPLAAGSPPTGKCSASAGSACCWLKPQCAGPDVPSVGTTSGSIYRPDPALANFSFVDTSRWVASEYKPARAANSLWWARYEEYEEDIKRELAAAKSALALPALRVFLHSLAFEAVGAEKHAEYLSRFLAVAQENGMKVGIVLFGDGWNHGTDLPHKGNIGANLSCVDTECCPVAKDGSVGIQGCHNGCWFANPQDHQRGTPPTTFGGHGDVNASYLTAQFKPFVENVVAPLRNSAAVLWWEAYNEPCAWRHYKANICTYFQVQTSTMIKELTYNWTKALQPQAPVISCWAEANNTFSDVLNVHLYNSDFASWNAQVFSECENNGVEVKNASAQCNRGAVVTEVRMLLLLLLLRLFMLLLLTATLS